MLQLPRGAGEADVRKAYKKLSLSLHPDRNHARGADDAFKKLAESHSTLLGYLGCERSLVEREWLRLKSFIMRDDNLRALKYHELYERLFDQFSDKSNPQHFYNVLLLAAVVQPDGNDADSQQPYENFNADRAFPLASRDQSSRLLHEKLYPTSAANTAGSMMSHAC